MEDNSLTVRAHWAQSRLARVAVIIVAALLLALGLFVGYRLGVWFSRDNDVKKVEDVREELVPVAKLAVYEYEFTDIMHLSEAHEILKVEVPFTRNHYVATVDGSVLIGIKDAELIDCKLVEDAEGRVESVTVELPHCEAWGLSIDHDSLNVLVDLGGIANGISKEQLNEMYISVEDRQQEKAEKESTIEKADERVRQLLTAHVQSLFDEEVEVSFLYLDRVSEAEE